MFIWCCVQVLNKVITVYAALCSEVKKLKYEVSRSVEQHLLKQTLMSVETEIINLCPESMFSCRRKPNSTMGYCTTEREVI